MSTESSRKNELTVDRRRNDRRAASERRHAESSTRLNGDDRRKSERRERVERRRQIDPTTCEREYTDPEIEFMKAMDLYKRRSGRQFPTWSEVLEVLHNLGYRKVAEPTDIYKQGQ